MSDSIDSAPPLRSVDTIHEQCGHEPERVSTRTSPHKPYYTEHDLPTASTTHAPPRISIDGDADHTAGPVLRTLSRLSPFGALLSRTLPEYSGKHNVGVFDIEVPVREPKNIGSFVLKDVPHAEPGFKLETVLFSVFYPAEKAKALEQRVVWFPKLSQTINGFLKMARRTSWIYKAIAYPIAAAAIHGTTFPSSPEAPLKKPKEGDQWPLIIFSHGVGCSRLMYSSWCGEMASRGYIVCAVEHRDGSGPSSSIKLQDGSVRDLEFVNWEDVTWPTYSEADQPTNDTRLRHDQLAMRKAEIEEIVKVMEDISTGIEVVETSVRSPHFDWERWGPKWNALNVRRPIMAGHSLGGSVALLAAADKEKNDFRSVLAYDPAIQRLEPWTGEIPCPMLCVNSEEFTLSSDFKRLQSLAQTAPNPPIYSIGGSTHPSFSDVFLIVPGFINRLTGLKVDADQMLTTTIDVTMAFLSGKGPLKGKQVINEWEGPIPATGPLGEPGDVNWHPNTSKTSLTPDDEEVTEVRVDATSSKLSKTASRLTKAPSSNPDELMADHQ